MDLYFDPEKPASLRTILDGLRPELASGTRSFFVHTQGTRARSCREEVTKASSLFLDLAIELRLPIVPVRFTGGLPVAPISGKLELPAGCGKQDYWIGSPIGPTELAALPYRDRAPRLVDAMNGLGPSHEEEALALPDDALAAAIRDRQAASGVGEVSAAVVEALRRRPQRGTDANLLLAWDDARLLPEGDDERTRWLVDAARQLLGLAPRART